MAQRYRIFFSREKFRPHSLTRFWAKLFFFSFFFHKKNTRCIFFSQEKFESHSLGKKNIICKKRSKNGKLDNFRRFSNFGGVFFFRQFFVFFFPGKVHISLTHSFSGSRKKKYSSGKKNTPFSLTHSIFAQKWKKLNFSREIKKYDTFA